MDQPLATPPMAGFALACDVAMSAASSEDDKAIADNIAARAALASLVQSTPSDVITNSTAAASLMHNSL